MVRLTDRFIFLPTSLVALGLAWRVERVRTRSADRTRSSAAARASWAFFSSLRDHKEPSSAPEPALKTLLGRGHVLLQERVLELLGVQLDPQLVRAHPGSGEQHRALDEVRRGRPAARLRVDHQLSGVEGCLTAANG